MEWTHTEKINAPADVVWQLVTDVAGWPRYLSTVQSVERLDDGPFRVGSRARIKQPLQRTAVWTVTRLTGGGEFTWHSERRGLTMTGTHVVVPDGQASRNTVALTLSGPLTPIAGLLMGPILRWVLRTENASFKAQAERRTPITTAGTDAATADA